MLKEVRVRETKGNGNVVGDCGRLKKEVSVEKKSGLEGLSLGEKCGDIFNKKHKKTSVAKIYETKRNNVARF